MFRAHRTSAFITGLVFCLQATVSVADPAQPERHVAVVVWDGMRPDFVSEENTPTLWKLASAGVVFRNHHAVYPSSTFVNGVTMATGVYPGHSGIIANREYRPEISRRKPIDTDNERVTRKADKLSGGKYIARPTVAELVRQTGRRATIAGAKGIGLLHDRHIGGNPEKNGVTLFAGNSLPPNAVRPIVARLGLFPQLEKKTPDARSDDWTTKALLDFLWKDGVPDFSLLWLSEPDSTEHRFAPGSKEVIAAMKSSDANLGRVLAALDLHRVREATDIFVVSDHGFSTIERAVDLRKILQHAGFDVAEKFANDPRPGQIMIVGNGGTVSFYIVGGGSGDSSVGTTAIIQRLVEFLQRSDFAGVIFSKLPLEGTFGLDVAKLDNEHAPDVMMAFRWNESKNQFGVPGMIDADWNRKPGQGTHATLSRFEMHNTLIAAGPEFQRGTADELPSGNVDLAPTILRIFKIAPPQEMDGRVLSEVMNGNNNEHLQPETTTIEAGRAFHSGKWRQTLRISRVGSTIYLDEGNGSFVSKP